MSESKKEKMNIFALRRKISIVGTGVDEERLLITHKFEEIVETYRSEKDKWYFSDFKLFKGSVEEVDVSKLNDLL